MPKSSRRKLKRQARRSLEQIRRDDGARERAVTFFRMAAELEHQAVEAAQTRSDHYNGYRVGVAALVELPDGTHTIVTGANRKAAPGARQSTDHCAEDDAEKQAAALNGRVIGEVVVSPHKVDDGTGFDLGVNISCWYCRRRYEPLLDDPELRDASPVKPDTIMRYVDLHNRGRRVDLLVCHVVALCRHKDNEKKQLGRA